MEEYIEEFENNEELTNKEYYCGLTYATEEGSGLVMKSLKVMTDDVSSEEYDLNIYGFIKLMISTYRNDPVFKNIASYFLALNGESDVENLASNDNTMKAFISNFHILINNYTDGNLEFDEESYKTLLDKSKSIKDALEKEREEKIQEFRKNETQVRFLLMKI